MKGGGGLRRKCGVGRRRAGREEGQREGRTEQREGRSNEYEKVRTRGQKDSLSLSSCGDQHHPKPGAPKLFSPRPPEDATEPETCDPSSQKDIYLRWFTK